MRILIAGINPAIKCQDNVAFIGTATNPILSSIVKATKLKPTVFAYDNLYPHPTPGNAPLTAAQMEVAATTGAYFLATYDGVIVLGRQAEKIMRKAELQYSLGEWTSIPHPSPRNPQTNDKEFIDECTETVNSFVFRIFASVAQSRGGFREEPRHADVYSLANGLVGNR